MTNWLTFFLLTWMFVIIQAFFAMMEMACVSFNRVRLHYYVSQNNTKAKWLSNLLNHPTQLFGTTLLGVNASLQFGSECSRRFYTALGLSPDWAPLTQVLIVVIFAELAPLFAARRYAEHVAMLGIGLLYLFSILMRPFIWCFALITRFLHYIFRINKRTKGFLTRDELQKAIETREDRFGHLKEDEFDTLVSNIFKLKGKSPKEIMIPLDKLSMLPGDAKVKDLRDLLQKVQASFCPIYYEKPSNIVGIVYPRDLLRLADKVQLKEFIRSPWFVSEKTSMYEVIKQFRQHNENHAVILSPNGKALGILTLDQVIDEILQETEQAYSKKIDSANFIVDCIYSSDTLMREIEKKLGVDFPIETENKTLEEVMTEVLGHHPSQNESVRVGNFELIVKSAPFLGPKSIRIRTIRN